MYSKIAIFFLNTSILLGLAEGTARVAEWLHPYHEAVAFDYAPYRMLRMSKAPWPLNEQGFRAPPLDSFRGSFLIEFLGGSVCLGVGENTGLTLPEQLEAALHRAGMRHARVLNLCQGGAPSAQELAIFLQYGLPLHPQVVLSFGGANDLMHPLPLGEDSAANLPYRDRELGAAVRGSQAVASHLALARVAARLAGHIPAKPRQKRASVAPAAIVDSYLYVTEIVRTLTEAQGGFYGLLLQPTLHYRKPWSAGERTIWSGRRPNDQGEFSRYTTKLFDRARISLRAWSAETGAPFYDLTGAFEVTTQTIYSDSVHFAGPAGYRTLAAVLEHQGLVDRIAERYQAWETSNGGAATYTWRH